MLLSCRLTNVQVLQLSTLLFTLFVVAEVVAAYFSQSLSLLGDAAAMSIDVFTYGCNLYAETTKAANMPMTPRMKYTTEVGLPLLSVSMLIAVTIYVTYEAVGILLEKESNDDVDIFIMYTFATINLFVDIACAVLFHIRGKEIFHTDTDESNMNLTENSSEHSGDDIHFADQALTPSKNLNMISAFFHIGGDTLRTIAIFAAALVATISHRNPDYCDAWAAIVVSVTIFFLAVPMLVTIFKHMSTISDSSSEREAEAFKLVSSSSSSDSDDVERGMEMLTVGGHDEEKQ